MLSKHPAGAKMAFKSLNRIDTDFKLRLALNEGYINENFNTFRTGVDVI